MKIPALSTLIPVLVLALAAREASALGWGFAESEVAVSRQVWPSAAGLVVAVIDTGADLKTPGLRDALWVNSGETGIDPKGRDKRSNGVDDDGNGHVDDVHGWNFAAGNSDLSDSNGHGTHVATLIAARPAEAALEGVAPGAKLMILKYYDAGSTPAANLAALLRALRYANRMGARIINYSGGGPQSSAEELEILRESGRRGILVVAAAGNEGTSTKDRPFYPASYPLDNILSVGGHDPSGRRVPSSNFGAENVDIMAPGHQILSSLPGGGTGLMTGTSQATAFASGAAALLWAQRPEWEPWQVIRHLRSTARSAPELWGMSRSRGRLSVVRSLALRDPGRGFSGLALPEDWTPDVTGRP